MAASDDVATYGGLASSVAGMVPGYGQAIGAVIGLGTSIASGVMKNNEAKKQAERAEELRRKSDALQKGALRPEYQKALRADQMAALYGLPEYNKYLENIDEGVANNARSIRESSPNGAATLAAISSVLGNANQNKESLFMKDALLQEQKREKANQTLWNTGDKQMDLVAMQRADKATLNQGAMNLENSATANKVGSIDQILASVGTGANMLGKIDYSGTGKNSTVSSPATNTFTGTSTTAPNTITMQDGTTLSSEQIAAILAASKTNKYGYWEK